MSEQKKYLSAEEIFAEEEQEELRREQKRLADLRDSEEGELEDLKPRNTWATVRRLWDEAADQRWRFVVVVIAIVFYTVCSIAAPAYSAHLIDYLDAGSSGRCCRQAVLDRLGDGRREDSFLPGNLDCGARFLFDAEPVYGEFCGAP